MSDKKPNDLFQPLAGDDHRPIESPPSTPLTVITTGDIGVDNKLSPETITALTEVIDYLWDAEAQDYDAEPTPTHIFGKLVTLRDVCEAQQTHTQDKTVRVTNDYHDTVSKENQEPEATRPKDQGYANEELKEYTVRIRETTEVVRVVEAESREGAEELVRQEWYDTPYPNNDSDIILAVTALTENDRPLPAPQPSVSPEEHISNRMWEASPGYRYESGKGGCDETFDILGPDSKHLVSISFWAEREKAEKAAADLVDRLNLPGLSAEAREETIRTALANYTQAVRADQGEPKRPFPPETLANAPDPVCSDCKHVTSTPGTHECPPPEYLQARDALMKAALAAEKVFTLDEMEAFAHEHPQRHNDLPGQSHDPELERTGTMNQYERNYKQLLELLPEGRDHIRIEKESLLPLCVERIWDNQISLCHYGESNGDLMQDPEVVFLISDGQAKPVYFRNAWIGAEHATVPDLFGDVPVKPHLQKGLDSLVSVWWANIKDQGFFEAAKELHKANDQDKEHEITRER